MRSDKIDDDLLIKVANCALLLRVNRRSEEKFKGRVTPMHYATLFELLHYTMYNKYKLEVKLKLLLFLPHTLHFSLLTSFSSSITTITGQYPTEYTEKWNGIWKNFQF